MRTILDEEGSWILNAELGPLHPSFHSVREIEKREIDDKRGEKSSAFVQEQKREDEG